MEQFPDGAHVRLRSRVQGGGYLYLHADEDGVGVSLRGHRGSLSVAWRVHRVLHGGATRVLLVLGWGTFHFFGESVYRLRGKVAIKLAVMSSSSLSVASPGLVI